MSFITQKSFAALKKGDTIFDALGYKWEVVIENSNTLSNWPTVVFCFNGQKKQIELTHTGEIFMGEEMFPIKNFKNATICRVSKCAA